MSAGGDARSFEFAFEGLEEGSLYAISTLGCIRSREDKDRFREGLAEMIRRLHPQTILVHGRMPQDVFAPFADACRFFRYAGWTERVKEGYHGHQ